MVAKKPPLKKLPPKSVDLSDNLYEAPIFFFSGDQVAAYRWLHDNLGVGKECEDVATYTEFSPLLGKQVYWIFVKGLSYDHHDLATLAHEVYHVVEFVMHDIGMKPHDKNSEAWAYLIDHLFLRILNSMLKKRVKRKEKPDD